MRSAIDHTRRMLMLAMACSAPAWSQSTQESQPAALLGRWRSLATSTGGIGSMMEFGPGNAFTVSPGVIVEFMYRLEGDQLVMRPTTSSAAEGRESVTWLDRDHVSFRSASPQDPGQNFTRKGESAAGVQSIQGEWLGSRNLQGRDLQVLRIFRPDGKGLFLMPFLTEQGQFFATGNEIDLELAGKFPTNATFRIEGAVLTMTYGNARTSRFERY